MKCAHLSIEPSANLILTVLHPRHKLEYFKKANWQENWINVARTIVWDEYEHTYKVTEGEIEDDGDEKVCDSYSVLQHLTIASDVWVRFSKYVR